MKDMKTLTQISAKREFSQSFASVLVLTIRVKCVCVCVCVCVVKIYPTFWSKTVLTKDISFYRMEFFENLEMHKALCEQ